MIVEISQDGLIAMLTAAAEAGAANALARLKPEDEFISQSEAWRIFGRRIVDRWVEDGKVAPKRVGPSMNSKKVYSRSELQSLAAAVKASEAIVRKYESHR